MIKPIICNIFNFILYKMGLLSVLFIINLFCAQNSKVLFCENNSTILGFDAVTVLENASDIEGVIRFPTQSSVVNKVAKKSLAVKKTDRQTALITHQQQLAHKIKALVKQQQLSFHQSKLNSTTFNTTVYHFVPNVFAFLQVDIHKLALEKLSTEVYFTNYYRISLCCNNEVLLNKSSFLIAEHYFSRPPPVV